MFSGGVCAGTTCPYKDIILSLLRQICPYKDRWRFLRVKKAVGSERAPPPKAMRFPPAPLFLDHKTSFFVRFSVSQNKDSCPYKDRICGKGSCPYFKNSVLILNFGKSVFRDSEALQTARTHERHTSLIPPSVWPTQLSQNYFVRHFIRRYSRCPYKDRSVLSSGKQRQPEIYNETFGEEEQMRWETPGVTCGPIPKPPAISSYFLVMIPTTVHRQNFSPIRRIMIPRFPWSSDWQ